MRGFAMHTQRSWEEKARDPTTDVQIWLRVAFAAFARHRQNGHASFAKGELLRWMGRADPVTGEVTLVTGPRLSDAISKAVERGWLAPGSTRRCLVVPAAHVEGGTFGRPDEPCQTCENSAAQGHGSGKTVPSRGKSVAAQGHGSGVKPQVSGTPLFVLSSGGGPHHETTAPAGAATTSPPPRLCRRCGRELPDCRCPAPTKESEESA
jgi:hypothetical protein